MKVSPTTVVSKLVVLFQEFD
ncbi:MAG: hypothetical protein JWO02_1665, partial [Solirubrobacterales bacterium]|nr:hypothetical protein [Solirubrobacterales bacterium]